MSPEQAIPPETATNPAQQESLAWYKSFLARVNAEGTVSPTQFLDGVQKLVSMVGQDVSPDGFVYPKLSLPVHDRERKAQLTFEEGDNSYITQGIIRIDYENGVREVIFGYSNQSFSERKDNYRLATYVVNGTGGVASYDSLLTGKLEKVEQPGETDLVAVSGEQMLGVFNRINEIYQEHELAKTHKHELVFGAREGQETERSDDAVGLEGESGIYIVGEDGGISRFGEVYEPEGPSLEL